MPFLWWAVWYEQHAPGDGELNWSQKQHNGKNILILQNSHDKLALPFHRSSSTGITGYVHYVLLNANTPNHIQPMQEADQGETELQIGFPKAACGFREEKDLTHPLLPESCFYPSLLDLRWPLLAV